MKKLFVSNSHKGFTLIELIFVIIILGVLAAVAFPLYISLSKNAEKGTVESEIGSLSEALGIYTANQLVKNQPITAHNPFNDLSSPPSNYAGSFGDVDGSNCPAGYWAYQSGNASNGNWAVIVYHAKATMTQAFTWSGMQWIIYVVNENKNASGQTIGVSMSEYPPLHQW